MTLKNERIPVSFTELFALLECLKKNIIFGNVDEFYHLSRLCLVKDEKHFDKFDRAFNNFFHGIQNYFSKKDIPILKDQKFSVEPIFICGMPRSGTTLCEQILSAHSKIFGAGELTYLPKILDKIYLKDQKSYEDTIVNIRSLYSKAIVNLSDKELSLIHI